MMRGAALLAAILAVSPIAAAQVRDRAAPATGTASIAGRVVSDTDPPRPVRRAVVTVNSPEWTGRTAITDDAGRFTFGNLPAGRYSLSVTKRGWAATSYGAKASGRPGRSIVLADGERASATVHLPRGAVISGVITNPDGSAPEGSTVRLMRYAYSNTGEKRLVPAPGSTWTDGSGAYRIYGLAPGDYYLAALGPREFLSRANDLHLTSDVDVQEAQRAVDTGPNTPLTNVPQRAVGLAPQFYPGTPTAAQAVPITVRAGEERSGVDVTLQYVAVSHVAGTVQGPDGPAPGDTQVTLVNNTAAVPEMGIDSIRTARLDKNGGFDFSGIAPGQYVLTARKASPAAPGSSTPPQVLSSIADVDVQGDDVNGLTLVLQEGLTVAGIVRADGTAPPPRLGATRVTLAPVQSGNIVTISGGGATVRDDGSFTLNGVTPGRYRLTLATPPPWLVRSATIGGQDSLDVPVEIRQSMDDSVITLTDRKSELSGRIENAAGVADYSIILFPENRALWVAPARRILTVRTAADGTYTFGSVPPGDYELAAVDDVEPGEWYDPAFLQRLVPSATKVTIAEGEKKVQDIKVGGGG